MIGENRGWSEILTVHEYAHIAHFTRPSRNPLTRLLLKLLPIPVDPILLNAPRWLLEGYATYIEGRLTGSGRPHGTWRPAVLRQWALEGQLPTYEELNSSSEMYGGSMAYLAGSAFVEWLVDKKGEESLPHLWRRMTARKKRSFNESFAGVFGGPPSELYGRFTAELTGRALASFSLGFGRPGKGMLSGEVVYGETGGSPNQFEQFSVGGLRPTITERCT